MSTAQRFCLPDVGEGLTEATILSWSVQPGDIVELNQIIVEVETAKAAVELPTPHAGTVTELHAAEGATVPVGSPLITVETPVTAGADAADATRLLVGYGPRDAEPKRQRVAAKPPVRKLAKDLGVDLAAVTPTGAESTVTREDVHRAATPSEPTQRETRVPIQGVRSRTAAAMVASAFTAPHVTEFITVDVTETMRLRDALRLRPEFRDLRVSPLLLLARAMLLTLPRHPEVNASWDEGAKEIVLKHYVNLGIAAATDRGLLVPNIKDADQHSLVQLAEALASLTDTARAGRTRPEDMSGGTITLTNVGVFGVDTGTPILNPGEAAILAFGAIRRTPWVVADEDGTERIEPRWTTQLALSFDHRLIDGQQGSEFLADLAALLQTPALAMR